MAPGATPRPRTRPAARRPSAAELRRRERRNRVLGTVLLCTALLVGLGTTAGYGIGRGAQWVRDVWPDPAPQLVADKAAPPAPLDVGGVAQACTPDAVGIELTGGSGALTPGDPVDLTLTVTNLGRLPCLVDASPSNLRVTVTDADGERVWSSADCTGGGENPALLGHGQAWEASTRWSGSTSNAKCEGKPTAVAAGTYTLTPALDDVPGAQGEPLTLAVAAPAAPPKGDADAGKGSGAGEKAAGDAAAKADSDGKADGDAKAGGSGGGDAKADGAGDDDETTTDEAPAADDPATGDEVS